MAGVTPDKVKEIDAKTIAEVSPSSLSTFLSNAYKMEQGQIGTSSPKEVKLYNAMEKQRQDLGLETIYDTPLWDVATTGKNRKKSEQDIRQAIVTQRSKDIMDTEWQQASPTEKEKLLQQDVDLILGADRIKKVETGDATLNDVWAKFQKQKQANERNQKLDQLFGIERLSK